MIPLSSIAAALCSALALAGTALHVVAARRLHLHMKVERAVASKQPADAVTHWRAVKRGVPQLAEKLDALLRAGRAGDQFLFGVDPDSPAVAECEALRARFPGHEIVVVSCEPGRAANPKISKFIQMAPHARHAHWLLTDSEAMFDHEFVEAFRHEWAALGCHALTAGYRFTRLRTLVQAFDAAPALFTLWPGLMHCRVVDFTLGACTGVRADEVAALGGWETFACDLAEDRQLGARIVARGGTVGLSRHVLSIESDPMRWRDWLKHQHRVAVTYRRATPLGALGLPIMHALPLALAAGCLGGSPWWWLPMAVVYAVRLAAGFQISRLLRFQLPFFPLVMAFVPMVESFFWLLAWLPLPVWWSGRWRRLG